MDLAELVHRAVKTFPVEERYGLAAHMKRTAVSVPSNIAEGQGRITRGEWRQFLGQARGSTLELQTQALLAQRLAYFSEDNSVRIVAQCKEVGRILNGLLDSSRGGA